MVDQMRTYTINKGMMDSWQKLFDTGIKPAHEALGIPVVAQWVNADHNQFIWVRRFADGADVPAKEDEFRNSDGFKSLGDQPSSHIARMDVQNLEKGALAG
ncbi:MAG: NIPSNAP family protein [Dehalococcoidia bacterium]|jgi:hypothetical protein|nr:NIPSNAP family protein [Dehalococcoidia bacterium]|tara:strand:+ start:399 stop:701 length:303 start_codon:yes stop_codon:yes gene_type:complete